MIRFHHCYSFCDFWQLFVLAESRETAYETILSTILSTQHETTVS